LSKDNTYYENVDAIFAIARHYGINIRMNLYRPTQGINTFTQSFIMPPDELIKLLDYIESKYKILLISDVLLSNILTNFPIRDPSGSSSLRILPNGKITPSTYLLDDRFTIGSILEKDIIKKIESSNIINNIITEQVPIECEGCEYVKSCAGGVIDRRYLWYGTLSKKDPYCILPQEHDRIKKLDVSNEGVVSVHNGYLPTMFFCP
jgi:radical SAM protein with 4Fe4S-binding SPASM domain